MVAKASSCGCATCAGRTCWSAQLYFPPNSWGFWVHCRMKSKSSSSHERKKDFQCWQGSSAACLNVAYSATRFFFASSASQRGMDKHTSHETKEAKAVQCPAAKTLSLAPLELRNPSNPSLHQDMLNPISQGWDLPLCCCCGYGAEGPTAEQPQWLYGSLCCRVLD